MSLLKYFRSRRATPATVAKERLQIIISHERNQRDDDSDYLMKMQEEILAVIARYVKIDRDQVRVQLERVGQNAILELNVTMPEVMAEEAAEA